MNRLIICLALLSLPLARADASDLSRQRTDFLIRFAKREASARLQVLTREMFPAGSDLAAQDFFLSKKEKLIHDIRNSRYEIAQGASQSTCMLTHARPGAPVLLHPELCSKLTWDEAVMLVIHESIHHLGVEDEAFAYSASELAYQAISSLPFQDVYLHCQPLEGWPYEYFVLKDPETSRFHHVLMLGPKGNAWVIGLSIDGGQIKRNATQKGTNLSGTDYISVVEEDELYGGVLVTKEMFAGGQFGIVSAHCNSERCMKMKNDPSYPFPHHDDLLAYAEVLCSYRKK